MADFRYRALDRHGNEYRKTITADSLHDAAARLRVEEVNLVALEAAEAAPRRRFEPVGPRPGPAPRDVKVRLRDQAGGLVLLIIGAAFTFIASIFIFIGIGLLLAGNSTGVFFTLFPLIHLAFGLGMLGYSIGTRAKRRRLYRDGEVAMATVEGVGYNRRMRVNGRNPYELVWTFDVAGHRYHERRSTFSEEAMTFTPGDRMWVLYDPDDPEDSVEWPPLK